MYLSSRYVTKRRAIAARLLACVLPVAVAAIGSAPAAAAAPSQPKIVTTNPVSSSLKPATSVTPLVFGEAESSDKIIIDSVPFGMRALTTSTTRSVEHPTKHPNYEIQIFDNGGCSGVPAATDTAEALEETGIPVGVPANAVTTLSAIQINPETSERSPCSNEFSYWEGNVPTEETSPGESSSGDGFENGGAAQGSGGASSGVGLGPATPVSGKPDAPHIHTSPGDRANDLTPLVVGSAPGASTVSVYSSSNCSGSPIATGTPSQLSSGFEVSVAPNAATTFSSVAIGGQHSGCSTPVTYTEDSTPPHTRVTMAPGVKTYKRKAAFRFKDVTTDPPGTTFTCKVDKAKWKPCSSPFHTKHLKLGYHVVSIRATDLAGNREPHPVKRRFRVVSR